MAKTSDNFCEPSFYKSTEKKVFVDFNSILMGLHFTTKICLYRSALSISKSPANDVISIIQRAGSAVCELLSVKHAISSASAITIKSSKTEDVVGHSEAL